MSSLSENQLRDLMDSQDEEWMENWTNPFQVQVDKLQTENEKLKQEVREGRYSFVAGLLGGAFFTYWFLKN